MTARTPLADVLGAVAEGEWWWAAKYTTTNCPTCEAPSHREARVSCEPGGIRWQLGVHLFLREGNAPEWNNGVVLPWLHPDPREALEALQAAGLAPPDDERRRWWCPTCGGSSARDDGHCPDCSSIGTRSAPPDLPTLVAVAAIGVGDWLRAEALAREVERDAVVVWRVMTAAALNDHFSRERGSRPPGAEVGAALVFALEDREEMGGDAWTEECPYAAPPVRRMWPALRGIARNEDGSPTGVHLVAHEPGRVTLAVESLS